MGTLKRSDNFRNLILAFTISFFILQIKSSDPYKRIFKSFSLKSVVSGSRPYVHMRSTMLLKLCQKLCSLKWRKFNFIRLKNIISLVSCISKIDFPLGLIKLRIVTLNLLIDFIFLILWSSLLYSLMQYEKNEFSNTLALARIGVFLRELDTFLH